MTGVTSPGVADDVAADVTDDVTPVTAALAQAVEVLRDQLGIANRRIDELQAALVDERRRLDLESEERRQLSERLHGLLTAPGKAVATTGFPAPGSVEATEQPTEPKPLTGSTVSAATSASSGLVIPRPRWWRRWVR
jgi:hypothetical protein